MWFTPPQSGARPHIEGRQASGGRCALKIECSLGMIQKAGWPNFGNPKINSPLGWENSTIPHLGGHARGLKGLPKSVLEAKYRYFESMGASSLIY